MPLFFSITFLGVIFEDNLYIIDNTDPEVFYPKTGTWSSWPKPKVRLVQRISTSLGLEKTNTPKLYLRI